MAKVDADHLASGNGYEPQRENNFYLSITGLSPDFDFVMLALRNITIPGHKTEGVVINWGNSFRKVSGGVTLEDMPLKCRDMVDKDVRKCLLKWYWKVYDPYTGKKGLCSDYKKVGEILLFAPDGSSNERVCGLQGIWPTGEPPTALTMDSQNPLDMDISLCVDKALWDLT